MVTVRAVEEAIAICERHDGACFAGPRAELVVSAETALGFSLPPSYRVFVGRLGAGSIGGFEIYGLIREPFSGVIPDAVGYTLRERDAPSNLPNSMIVIGSDGMGGDYVLDVSKGEEPPVEVWEGGRSIASDQLERVGGSFGEWLLANVKLESEP